MRILWFLRSVAVLLMAGRRTSLHVAAQSCSITQFVCDGACVSSTTNCCRDNGEYACRSTEQCCGGTCCGSMDNCCGSYCVGMMDSCGGSTSSRRRSSSGSIVISPTQTSSGSGTQSITMNAGNMNAGDGSGGTVIYVPAPPPASPTPPPPSFFEDTAGKIVTACGVLTAIGGVWACWKKNAGSNKVHARGP